MYFYVVVSLFKITVVLFSAGDIIQKYFRVRSNLHLIHFECFQKKLFMLKETK